ncbi:MAG: biopolymer transporter ExbD [Candidatus Firestonebacteria bacterium]
MLDLKSARKKVFSEINITPLTDIALVLLVIFMITAPLIVQSGIKVKLPGAVTQDAKPEQNVIVTVTAEGKIFLANQEIPADRLLEPLSAMLAVSGSKIVVVNADKGVTHGVVVSVLDAARRAGAEKLSVSTSPLKPQETKKK